MRGPASSWLFLNHGPASPRPAPGPCAGRDRGGAELVLKAALSSAGLGPRTAHRRLCSPAGPEDPSSGWRPGRRGDAAQAEGPSPSRCPRAAQSTRRGQHLAVGPCPSDPCRPAGGGPRPVPPEPRRTAGGAGVAVGPAWTAARSLLSGHSSFPGLSSSSFCSNITNDEHGIGPQRCCGRLAPAPTLAPPPPPTGLTQNPSPKPGSRPPSAAPRTPLLQGSPLPAGPSHAAAGELTDSGVKLRGTMFTQG